MGNEKMQRGHGRAQLIDLGLQQSSDALPLGLLGLALRSLGIALRGLGLESDGYCLDFLILKFQ